VGFGRGLVVALVGTLASAVILIVGVPSPALAGATVPSSNGLPLDKASGFYGVADYKPLPDGGALIKAGRSMDAGFVIPFDHVARGEKLEFRFRHLRNFRYFLVDFAKRGERFLERGVVNTDMPGNGGASTVYYARIPDGDYGRIRLTFRSRNVRGDAVLDSITVHPLGVRDGAVWPYLITLGIGILLLAPGLLLYGLFHRTRLSAPGLQVSLFPYSLLFYVAVCLFLLAMLGLGLAPPRAHGYTLLFSAVLLGILLLEISRRRAWEGLAGLLRSSYRELTAYVLLLMVLCLVVAHDANLPLDNLYYRHIAGPKTFGAFSAHDGMLQYVNGLAIANNEPFEKYYGDGQLIYGVEDRQILPGVVYGALRAVLGPLSGTLEGSYFVYTMLGIAMNLMVIFPVAAIGRRFLGTSSTVLMIVLVGANGFMIGNCLITWFKMTAGALFLSGLYLLLDRRPSTGRWAASGLHFGLAANMHAGAALGIPFFYLWAAWRGFRENGLTSVRSYLGPLVLVLAFAATLAPWTIIKRLDFHDNYTEIKTHFLGGYSSPKGLGASVRLFLKKTTLEEQYSRRLTRLWESFRLEELAGLSSELGTEGMEAFMHRWDRDEFNYVAFVLYPAALFAGLAWVYGRMRQRPNNASTAPGDEVGRSLGLIAVVTTLIIVLAHFGRHPPDIVYHQPMGVLVLADMVLVSFILKAAPVIQVVYLAYAAFAVVRLGLFL
jgi:hypothetical protein